LLTGEICGIIIIEVRLKMGGRKPPTTMKENVGKVLIDLEKLTFGSFILGGILRGEIPQYLILLSGSVISALGIVLGLLLTAKEKE
jgi:hypothetical protein